MKNTVKETQSVVGVFSRDGKFKGVSRPKMYEGEKYILKENEMIFYLREKSTTAHNSGGSHRDMFHYCSNNERPQNVVLYKKSEYILWIFYTFQYFRSTGVFFFLYRLLFFVCFSSSFI